MLAYLGLLRRYVLVILQSRSNTVAEKIMDTCGKMLVVPVCTRWNSTFHAMERVNEILDDDETKTMSLFDHLGHRHLQEDEKVFIQEYVTTMQYFAWALDILQGDEHMFLGYLLPTIHVLKGKLLEVKTILKLCRPLADGLVAGLDKRFGHLLHEERYVLASVCHPKFKNLDFIEEEEKRKWAFELFHAAVEKEMLPTEGQDVEKPKDKTASFFPTKRVLSGPKQIIDNFVNSDSEALSLLNAFPVIKKVFIQTNTTLPSSASVERLFSHTGELFQKKRCRMSDTHFEQQLPLQLNKSFL